MSDIHPSVVIVRGRDNFAYEAETGQLWRIEGTRATAVVRLPSYPQQNGGPFGGALRGGAMIIGGLRCGDAACDTTAYEATIVNGDRPLKVEVAKAEVNAEEADGMRFVGVVDGSALVTIQYDLYEIGARGGARPLAQIPDHSETCLIDGQVFAVTRVTTDVADQTPVTEPIVPGALQEVEFFVQELRSGRWSEVGGSRRRQSFETGGDAYCGGGSFEIRDALERVKARWTPDGGWEDASATPRYQGAEAMTSRGRRLVFEADGDVVDTASGQVVMHLTAPEPGTSPPLLIDGSTDALFGCVVYAEPGPTLCRAETA